MGETFTPPTQPIKKQIRKQRNSLPRTLFEIHTKILVIKTKMNRAYT
jgi:hypothetical protein